MSTTWKADRLVSVRSKNLDRYKHNFLKQAVCELRFPTLMELGESRPPASLVTALRKEYPHLELANEVMIGIGGGSSGSSHAHIFRSAKLTWTASLKQSAISVETTAYAGYPNMKERILRVVEAASKIIDSDFFTRVGLRYINVIDVATDPADGWVNPALVHPLLSHQFSGIHDYAGRIQLMAEDGGCLFQHGVRLKEPQRNGTPVDPEYLLDIDSFRNEVSLADTESALDAMHAQAFDVFDWAIGDKARDYLTQGGT